MLICLKSLYIIIITILVQYAIGQSLPKLSRDFDIFSTQGEHGNDKVENGV